MILGYARQVILSALAGEQNKNIFQIITLPIGLKGLLKLGSSYLKFLFIYVLLHTMSYYF